MSVFHAGARRARCCQADGMRPGANIEAPSLAPAVEKPRVACQDFLALRKDADPDIRIVKQARRE